MNGQFAGWISKEYGICWSVNRWRRDKRTGVVRSEGHEGNLEMGTKACNDSRRKPRRKRTKKQSRAKG